MAYTVTTVFTRPDTSVEWFTPDRTIDTYAGSTTQQEWFDSGKKTGYEETESDDALSLTVSSVFSNEDSFLEYDSDPIIDKFRSARRQYYFENEVTSVTTRTES